MKFKTMLSDDRERIEHSVFRNKDNADIIKLMISYSKRYDYYEVSETKRQVKFISRNLDTIIESSKSFVSFSGMCEALDVANKY